MISVSLNLNVYLTHNEILRGLKGVRYLNLVVTHLSPCTIIFARNLLNYNVAFLYEIKHISLDMLRYGIQRPVGNYKSKKNSHVLKTVNALSSLSL